MTMTLWRIFPTEQQCLTYCRQQFAQMARERAALNNDELFDYTDGKRPVNVRTLPDAQITGARFPLWGKNAAAGAWNTESGFTTAWAEPRETADGQWAVQARDPSDPEGQPEPAWPVSLDDL
jgi:hypothetical protein